MTAPDRPSSSKNSDAYDMGLDSAVSGTEAGAKSQREALGASANSGTTARVQELFRSKSDLSKFPQFPGGVFSGGKPTGDTAIGNEPKAELLAMGDTANSPKDASPFEFLGKGTDAKGRDYLSFKAPDTMDVKDIKYYPDTDTFKMEPKGELPKKPADPTDSKKIAQETALPIIGVEMDPDKNSVEFELAQKAWIDKGWGKSLNFGGQRPDGSIKFSGKIDVNDGTNFHVNDVKGITGIQARFEKHITSFTMHQKPDGKHHCVPHTMWPGDVARKDLPKDHPQRKEPTKESPESLKRQDFQSLTGNAKLYMTELSRLKLYIAQQLQLTASRRG